MPLTDRDRSQINDTMQRILTPSGSATARFVASVVTVAGEGDLSVDGVLGLHGIDQPVRLRITRTGADRFHGAATVTQSAYGIKPYSAMFGALKLRDEVRVEFDVDLDAAEVLP
jgi:polyisoprenoid-binding protein YceI